MKMKPNKFLSVGLLALLLLYMYAVVETLITKDMLTHVLNVMEYSMLTALGVLTVTFFIGIYRKRWDGIDVAWGYSGTAIALVTLWLHEGNVNLAQILASLAVIVWGVRLGTMIALRQKGTSEQDPRYTKIISSWKNQGPLMVYLRLYFLQAVLITIICVPIIHINTIDGVTFGIVSILGFVVWGLGFFTEVLADKQLSDFKKLPKGSKTEICQTGLRAHIRHPQYLGEMTQWWGIAIMCLGTPYGWVGLLGPAVITYFLRYVSGVPIAEKRLATKDGWQAYRKRTNLLIPSVRR